MEELTKKELLDYLEEISQQLNNIALDQIPFAISELYFKLENSIPILLIEKKIQKYNDILEYAETEEGLAEIKDFEYDEAKYGKKILQELLDERNSTDE